MSAFYEVPAVYPIDEERQSSSTADVAVGQQPFEPVRVFGPASLSNLGPGFDTLGLCIGGIGDYVEAVRTDEPGVKITGITGDGGKLSLQTALNTASVAAKVVLEALGAEGGLALRIEKQVPFGSGIGGSAASAVAGAWAANVALGSPLEKSALVQAVLAGEAVASGERHGDNVLPALLGGMVLVSSSDPHRYRSIALPRAMDLAVVVPEITVLTRTARAMLPARVGLRDAVHNASELAFLVDAFRAGDWETVGRCIMEDRLVEPLRATLVSCYSAAKTAALDAGAFGAALTGSGPAMFALASSPDEAAVVLEAMLHACSQKGVRARGIVSFADGEGVRQA